MIARFVLRRLAIFVLQLAGITAAVFVAIRLLPADPAAQLVGMNATPDTYAQARHTLGLDLPMWRQVVGPPPRSGPRDHQIGLAR